MCSNRNKFKQQRQLDSNWKKNGETNNFVQNKTFFFLTSEIVYLKFNKKANFQQRAKNWQNTKQTVLLCSGKNDITHITRRAQNSNSNILTSQLKKKIMKRRKTGKLVLLKSFILLIYLFSWSWSLFLRLMDVENQKSGGEVDDIEQETILWSK